MHMNKAWFTCFHDFGLAMIVFIFSLPVIQLMVTYQKISNSTGDQDLCYYNYLCAHPLGLLSDFNHVYSNLGYIMLGLLFMVIVRLKERQHKHQQHRSNPLESGNVQLLNQPPYGVPQYFGKKKNTLPMSNDYEHLGTPILFMYFLSLLINFA